MQKHLALDSSEPFYLLERLRKWKTIKPGTQLPKSIVLFPRVDPTVKKAGQPDQPLASNRYPELKPEITIEQFSTVDLRVGAVVRTERIPRAKKILKLEVDIGQKRIIVAGIAENYTPEELVGKQVIVVANLKPAKLMGIVSNGMLVAAVGESGPTLATLDKPVDPGTPLR
jgi:methionyl-tRNA synthetase